MPPHTTDNLGAIPAPSPAAPGSTPAADLRRTMIDARITRRLLAVASIGSIIGSGMQWFTAAGQAQQNPIASSLIWLGFSLLSALMCALPDRQVQRAITPFLGATLFVLMADAMLAGHALLSPGLMALPLALLLAALLVPMRSAVGLTVCTVAGLLVFALGPSWLPSSPPAAPIDTTTHLYALVTCCISALMVGRFVAVRFSEQALLSVRHEYRYRDLFDRIPSAVLLHDQGRVLDANRAALNLLALSRRDELMGTDLRQYLPGSAAQRRFEARMNDLVARPLGETLPLTEFALRRADGRLVQVRATATTLHDLDPQIATEDGQRTGSHSRYRVLSFLLDDTERHQAQTEASRARTLMNSIIDHSPYAVSLVRRHDAVLLECNAAYLRMVGRARADVLNRSILDLGIWPDPAERRRFIDAVAQRRDADTEHTISLARPNGNLRTVKGTVTLLQIDGVEHVLLIGRDITDTLLREAVHEAVVDSAPVGLAITHGGRVVSANPELHRIFHRPPGSMVGRAVRDLWQDRQAHDQREQEAAQAFSASGLVRFEQDFHIASRAIAVRIQGRRVSSPHDEKPTVVWIMEDITQERIDAQALRDAATQAEEASRAKSMFLANMSHELRTPLNGILGLLDMSLDDEDQAPPRRQIELARESARVLADLVNDVLDLAKIEAGRLELHEEPFDLNGLLASVEAVYRVIAEARGIFLRFDSEAARLGRGWVRGDALRVRQILGNYLSNALKFTESGGVELIVRRPEDLGPVRIEVRDSGPGIDSAVQARLFQPFEQGDASPTRRQGGSGLGLAICRELAELMGGRVGLSSTVGRGSCFWVELPLPPAAVPQGPGQAPSDEQDFTGLRVLVADDNAVNVLIAEAMIKRAGALVHCVHDGHEAVRSVEEAVAEGAPFQVVLMDIQMPVVDGLEAARILRQRFSPEQLPIIALTAGALQSERDAALAAGMNDFVTKPVDRPQLLACVARWSAVARAAPPTADPQTPGGKAPDFLIA